MRGPVHLFLLTLLLSVGGVGLLRQAPAPDSTAGLWRSDAVIEIQIARKQAKLDSHRDKPQSPDGYARHRSRVRPHPEGANVMDLLLEAKQRMGSMPEIQVDRDAGIWNWTWLGPGNIGGRIRAILTHPTQPNTLWIGSAGGGIWKTTDAGNTWNPLTDFMPSLAVTAMAMDPHDSDIIYASTGEGFGNIDGLPGAGIFKSTNGGNSWFRLAATDSPLAHYVNDLAHHPGESGWMIACGVSDQDEGYLWRTEDGGVNWNQTYLGGHRPMDVKYDHDHPEVVMVGTQAGVLRSEDAGLTWTHLNDGIVTTLPLNTGRCEIAFGLGNDVVYLSIDPDLGVNEPQGEIWRSLDNGLTWEKRSELLHLATQGWYDNVIWAMPFTEDALMVGGVELFSSFDGGETLNLMNDWTSYHTGTSAHADIHAIVPHTNYGEGEEIRIYIGNDGGIQVALNGIQNQPNSGWLNLANGLGITQFYGADTTPFGDVILGGTQDNDDIRYTAGQGTNSWYQAQTGDGTYTAIDPVNPGYMYACYPRLGMQRSTNGGASYHPIVEGLEDSGDRNRALFISPFALDKTDPTILIAGGRSIWISEDRGSNWSELEGPLINFVLCSAVEVAPTGSQTIWVGYETGEIRKTENGGDNWMTVAHEFDSLPDTLVTDIEISHHDPQTVMVTFGGYLPDRVWRTTNAGVSWQPVTGSGDGSLPEVQMNCVTYHPSNPDWLYLGSDVGLFASDDGGQSWNVTPRYNSSEGPVYTEVSDLIWHSGSTLVAVTHGRGMYQCRPLDEVWVDAANSGAENGTYAHPYNTLLEGYQAMGHGSGLNVIQGEYNETGLVLEKRSEVRAQEGTVIIR